jgi:hypothetical protein
MIISLQNYHQKVWAIQKKEEIKDTYPKKVCHVPTRHIKKKRKKRKDAYPKKVCHMPTRYVKKKERKENIAHTKKNNNNIKEREKSCKGVPPPSTKNIYTLAHLDQGL